MKNSFCELLLLNYPKLSEFEGLRTTYIANCVFNNILCFTAILWNILTIHALRKTSSLPKTLKTLLLSLAVSDVSVGLLVQPFYTSLLVDWLQHNNPGCSPYKGFYIIGNSFSAASFLGVVAVSVDRFLAIHLHLRYQELVTHKRVVAVVIAIWVLSVILPLIVLWVPLDVINIIVVILGGFGLLFTTLFYIRIYLAVRRHNNQIQALQVEQVAQTEEIANFASLIKSVLCIFYVYAVFLLCYFPFFVCMAITHMNGPSITSKRCCLFAFTLVFLNSSLNPVIYCWKMRHIRQAFLDLLRNMSWLRNSASH